MTKKEIIWREILFQARENKTIKFTQKKLAEKFGISVSTVFNSLKPLRNSGAVRVTGRFFVLENYKKLLYLWASERKLSADIYHSAHSDMDINTLEGFIPPDAVFGLYSGFKILYGQAPADYDHLYVYLDESRLKEFLERVRQDGDTGKKGRKNIFLIKPDERFGEYPQPIPEQLLADIWSAPEWYAKDFITVLEEKLNL